jgi:hypothetical protein
VPPLPPDCSIDYRRRFSLPLGVPPTLTPSNQNTYFQNMRCTTQILSYRGQAAAAPDPLDPGTPADKRLKNLNGAGKNPLVPHTLHLPGTVTAAPAVLTPAQIDGVGKKSWTAVVTMAGKTLAEAEATRFRWDDDARKVAVLPQPLWAEESLLGFWLTPASGSGLLAAPIAGILQNDASTHALATSTTQLDGEMAPALLRAPVIGLARFERYRHVLMKPDNSLEAVHPSAAGAWVIKATPNITPPPTDSPLFAQNWLILENVDGAAAESCLAALTYIQLLKFDDILATKKFDKELAKQCRQLLGAWLAYLEIVYPVKKKPADPSIPLSSITDALKTPFQGQADVDPNRPNDLPKQIKDLLEFIQSDSNLKNNLKTFISDYYAPVLCGKSWHELDVDIPKDPRPPQTAALSNLEYLPFSKDAWLVCYAGCPLGQAAPIYVSDPNTPPPVVDLPLQAFTVFELEALAIAGKIKELFPAATEPSLADPLSPLDLSDFEAQSPGCFCSLRLLQNGYPKVNYTIRDWLSEVVKGSNFGVILDRQVAMGLHHPLESALDMDTFYVAQIYRTAMNTLNTAKVGAVRLDKKLLDWWLAKTDLAVGNQWPTRIAGGADGLSKAGPDDPFLTGETRRNGLNSGYDEFDLEAVGIVQKLVFNTKEPGSPIPFALMLALMQTEGFRWLGTVERTGITNEARRWKPVGAGPLPPPAGFVTENNIDPALRAKPRFFEGIITMDWVRYPFGLDIFNQDVPNNPADIFLSSKTSFINRFVALKAVPVITPDITEYYAHAYLVARLQGAFLTNSGIPKVIHGSRTTRRLQWLGILCQMAEFQGRHKELSVRQSLDLRVNFELVDELASPVSPIPGPNANSPERRAYLAYWSLVYLYFNAAPGVWNAWVRHAKLNKPAGSTVSEYILFNHHIATPAGCADIQRANMLRFAVALDAYLRLDLAGNSDASDPAGRVGW